MKNIILSLAFAGSILLAASACHSTKSVTNSTDSTAMRGGTADTAVASPMDTVNKDTVSKDTTGIPPDTTKTPKL